MKFMPICLATFLAMVLAACADLEMTATSNLVELANDVQKVSFVKSGGKFHLTTYVREGVSWEPLFDAQHPLAEGSSFNLDPTSYSVATNTADRKAVYFYGNDHGYNWDLYVRVKTGSPLVKFVLNCHLGAGGLLIDSPQPDVAFWMNDSSPTVLVEQGPMSIYGPNHYYPRSVAFPAAYLWDNGREAAVFFNMTPMTWMGGHNSVRFKHCAVKSISSGGQTGLGLDIFNNVGSWIPNGDMLIEYYLFGASRAAQPTKLDGLDKMVQVFAEIHPATASFPATRMAPNVTSWESYTQKGIEHLLAHYWDMTSWDSTDSPVNLVSRSNTVRIHPDRPGSSGYDFSTCYNHLSSSILYSRLHSDTSMRDMAMRKKNDMPTWYVDSLGLIDCWQTWQSFSWYAEMMRTHETLAAGDFNPAIAGRCLMATRRLMQFADNVNYVFPQFYYTDTLQPRINYDQQRSEQTTAFFGEPR